jgi:hypothetical protein
MHTEGPELFSRFLATCSSGTSSANSLHGSSDRGRATSTLEDSKRPSNTAHDSAHALTAGTFYEPTIVALDGPGARHMNRLLRVCFASALSLLASSAHHSLLAQDGNPILALRGRWAGNATLTPATGPTEPYSCVATYFPSGDGSSVRQNLRCKSANYQFDGAAPPQNRSCFSCHPLLATRATCRNRIINARGLTLCTRRILGVCQFPVARVVEAARTRAGKRKAACRIACLLHPRTFARTVRPRFVLPVIRTDSIAHTLPDATEFPSCFRRSRIDRGRQHQQQPRKREYDFHDNSPHSNGQQPRRHNTDDHV